MANSFKNIPAIDISCMRDGANGLQDVASAIHEAATDIGFFYVKGHTVKQAVTDRTLEAAKAFFALEEEQKNKVKVNRNHRQTQQ